MGIGFLNLIVVVFIIAQFVPEGQKFLSTDLGGFVTVVLAGLCIISMLPSLLLGNIISLIFIGIWCWIAWPKIHLAKKFFLDLKTKIK